jgi:hypothetical protein
MAPILRFFVWYTLHCDTVDTATCLLTQLVISSQKRLRPLSIDDTYGVQCLHTLQCLQSSLSMNDIMRKLSKVILCHRAAHRLNKCRTFAEECYVCSSIDKSLVEMAVYPKMSSDEICLSL